MYRSAMPVLGAILLAAQWSPSQVARGAVPGVPRVTQRSDPCGFRYAAWPSVQAVASFAVTTPPAAGRVASIRQYGDSLSWTITGLARDYGKPTGSQTVVTAARAAIMDALTGVSADADVSQLWSAINAECPWLGQTVIWTGDVNEYGLGLTDTSVFHVPRNWIVSYAFRCGTASPGFMLAIHTPDGAQRDIAVASSRPHASGTVTYAPPGRYFLRVITRCLWHVNVTKGSARSEVTPPNRVKSSVVQTKTLVRTTCRGMTTSGTTCVPWVART